MTVQVIKEHRGEFPQEMNARNIASQLQVLGLIPEALQHGINHSKHREDANGCLLTFLLTDASDLEVHKNFEFCVYED